jgi:putative transposase
VAEVVDLLNVSPQYVGKWRIKYEASGAEGLTLGYRGGESYLSTEERTELIFWIKSHETITIETVRDYLEETSGVVYQSKQSYYDLLAASGRSYHKSEKQNPKRDEAQVLVRREEIKKTGATLE